MEIMFRFEREVMCRLIVGIIVIIMLLISDYKPPRGGVMYSYQHPQNIGTTHANGITPSTQRTLPGARHRIQLIVWVFVTDVAHKQMCIAVPALEVATSKPQYSL
jgi:hypothetical protein